MTDHANHTWYVDIFRVGDQSCLVVFDGHSRRNIAVHPVGGTSIFDARAALLAVLDHEPVWPALIVTDHSAQLAGIGDDFDIPTHVRSPMRLASKSPSERHLAR